jgi:hypothetical protein
VNEGAKQIRINGSDELQKQIVQIDAEIEELADTIERCRRIILIAKVAIIAGGGLIFAVAIGAIRFDPTVMIGAIATVIGGIVVFGSNTSTLKQTASAMEVAKARRTLLMVAFETGGGSTWSSSK